VKLGWRQLESCCGLASVHCLPRPHGNSSVIASRVRYDASHWGGASARGHPEDVTCTSSAGLAVLGCQVTQAGGGVTMCHRLRRGSAQQTWR
jgi:hypothetical protein